MNGILIFATILWVSLLGFGIYYSIEMASAPCSDFRNTTVKNIPARCVRELTQ